MDFLFRRIALPALLLATASLRADINLPAPAALPPQAEALSVRVLSGQEATIELRGHHAGGGSIQFAIVRPPTHGKLSRLRNLGENHARITYAVVGSHGEMVDGFSYVAQAGGRVSSPAEVRIEVEEAPARLQVPEELDFGEIAAGMSATRELPIRNLGGGVLQGRLTISHPWMITPAEYRVEAGASQTITVAFRPNEAKSFVGQVTLSGAAGDAVTVSLAGSATAPEGSSSSPPPNETPVAAPEGEAKKELLADSPPSVSPAPAPTVGASATASEIAATPSADVASEERINSAVTVTARRLSPSTWELRWPADKTPGITYRIEERLLSLDPKGELQTTWLELGVSKINAAATAVKAQIGRLDPRQLHMLRVSALDPKGTTLWEAPLVALAAERTPSRRRSLWLLGLGGVLATALLLRWRASRLPA